jgi:hypothetical protein
MKLVHDNVYNYFKFENLYMEDIKEVIILKIFKYLSDKYLLY